MMELVMDRAINMDIVMANSIRKKRRNKNRRDQGPSGNLGGGLLLLCIRIYP
jgi:hypothetical protein